MMHDGCSFSEIGRRLHRSASTISREVHRNGDGNAYYPRKAHYRAYERLKIPRKPKKVVGRIRQLVENGLRKYWSPEQIAGRAQRDGHCSISHPTIYAYVYSAKGQDFLGQLRGPDKGTREKRALFPRIHGRIMMDQRPAEAETREVPGHWEGDTIQGRSKKDACLATLVDRASRYLLADLLPRCNAASLNAAVSQRVAQGLPFKTLTVDNGMEFASHRQLTSQTQLPIYFSEEKKPWQRGTNENTNGLLRQFFPKKTDFSTVSPAELRWAVDLLNNRPRKSLGYKTPKEVMESFGFALVS
jgi:IS30 family transposase